MPSPLAASSAWSGAEIFSFATGVNLAALGGHLGARAAQGKKPHQGIFSNNPALRVGEIWAKWPGTHQDSETWWRNTASGSALDANGSTLSDAQGRSFTWDFENRLAQAVNPGVGTTTFKYDPFGRRIQKSGPLGTANYLYDGSNILEQTDGIGNVLTRVVEGNQIDEWLSIQQSGQVGYFDTDGIDSTTSLASSSASITKSYTFDSFGDLLASSGTPVNAFEYAAREFDSETGIYLFRARYYDASVGRFVSQDPIGFRGGNNFYVYALNNPVLFNDPLGQRWQNTGKPANPNTNTIVCNGNGGISIQLSDAYQFLPELLKCVGDCIRRHEDRHRRDALASNPTICHGVASGIQIGDPNGPELDSSEIAAYTIEIQCLEEKKRKEKCPQCRKDIDDRIGIARQQIGKYKFFLAHGT